MLRLLIVSAIGALLLFVTPVSAQTSPDMLGRMRGAWDLPTDIHPGRARGALYYLAKPIVGLEARLTPLIDPTTKPGGRIDGVLRRMTDTGLAREALAEVHGTYVVGADGLGRFEAVITKPAIPGVRPEPIGKMEGTFGDPMMRDRDPVGRFVGTWALRF
jgi:hypothetical protein